MGDNESNTGVNLSAFSSIRSPLSMFGAVIFICNSVFSASAVISGQIEAFKYSIHMFLGIVFVFVMIALLSPRSLYHPRELEGLKDTIPEYKYSGIIIISVVLFIMLAYMFYQKIEIVSTFFK